DDHGRGPEQKTPVASVQAEKSVIGGKIGKHAVPDPVVPGAANYQDRGEMAVARPPQRGPIGALPPEFVQGPRTFSCWCGNEARVGAGRCWSPGPAGSDNGSGGAVREGLRLGGRWLIPWLRRGNEAEITNRRCSDRADDRCSGGRPRRPRRGRARAPPR